MKYTSRTPPGDGGDEGPPDGLRDDLLHSAAEIARYVFGDERARRKVYHLVATTKMPVFRLGTMICARRKVLLVWIEEQERRVPQDIGGHHRRKDGRADRSKGKPDEPTSTPACPPPRPRGPVPAGGAAAPVPPV